MAVKSAKLMIFKNNETKSKSKIVEDIANYLKHSGNRVSRPLIALEIDEILKHVSEVSQ